MRISVFVFVALAVGASVAQAQSIKRGTIDGTIVTRSTFVAQNTSSVVYMTPTDPKGGHFVLMHLCVEDQKDMVLSGDTMGDIVFDDDCMTFSPGLAIPPGETLTFTEQNNNDQSAHITGILTK